MPRPAREGARDREDQVEAQLREARIVSMPAEAEPAPAVDTIPAPNPDPTRIHLYRPQNQLGDLLLTVPAIRSIRQRFPRAHIVLVVGRQNADAVLGQPWADVIRVVETRNFLGVLRAGGRRG